MESQYTKTILTSQAETDIILNDLFQIGQSSDENIIALRDRLEGALNKR